MKTVAFSATLAFLLLLPFVVSASTEGKWTYEGHFGPEHWANFDVDYHMCGDGEQQSPIDIVNPHRTSLAEITLHWQGFGWTARNTGHTIEFKSKDGGYAMIEGERFALESFHFHTPSEHAFDGLKSEMEAHFVHRAEDGRVAVIAVMLRGGGQHQTFDRIMASSPTDQLIENPVPEVDLSEMVTDLGDIVRYQGSLTTPPCTENVMWTVLTDPLTISDTAILAFTSLFKMNARPLQPLNRRFILSD